MENKQEVQLMNKKVGETPLEALNRLRKEKPEYEKETLTYAGRLDPMAEGLLLVLVGEETKNKEKYLNLDKTYTFEILFGFETDTYDILGKIINQEKNIEHPMFDISPEKLTKTLPNFVGKIIQDYPSYSSKTVKGKPMFEYAREGNLDQIEIPTKEVEIYGLEIIGSCTISSQDLLKEIESKIKLVNGDFRQEEILDLWQKNLLEFSKQNPDFKFFITKIRTKVSSGTYIRSLAHRIGKKLNMPALALSIKREKVGEYSI